jgi:hypothetical protein
MDRRVFLSKTGSLSFLPLMILYKTPGRSRTLPPRTKTLLCSWRLWPMPGIWAMRYLRLVRRILATFQIPELGFLGVVV